MQNGSVSYLKGVATEKERSTGERAGHANLSRVLTNFTRIPLSMYRKY